MSVRSEGVLDRSSRLAPHDHVAWCGDGAAGFLRLAGQLFATAADGERLVLVGDLDRVGADAGALFADQLETGRLRMFDVAEAYRPLLDGGAGSAGRQLDAFRRDLDAALAAGWSGLRVAADNTVVLTTDELESRWLAWEQLTDRWQALMPVTGVCYFDRRRVPAARLDRVTGLHPLCGGVTLPPLRVYHDTEPDGRTVLVLDGSVEAFDEDELRERLATEVAQAGGGPGGDTAVTVDLSRVTYLHHHGLRALQDAGVRVRNAPGIVRRLNDVLPEADRLRLD